VGRNHFYALLSGQYLESFVPLASLVGKRRNIDTGKSSSQKAFFFI